MKRQLSEVAPSVPVCQLLIAQSKPKQNRDASKPQPKTRQLDHLGTRIVQQVDSSVQLSVIQARKSQLDERPGTGQARDVSFFDDLECSFRSFDGLGSLAGLSHIRREVRPDAQHATRVAHAL